MSYNWESQDICTAKYLVLQPSFEFYPTGMVAAGAGGHSWRKQPWWFSRRKTWIRGLNLLRCQWNPFHPWRKSFQVRRQLRVPLKDTILVTSLFERTTIWLWLKANSLAHLMSLLREPIVFAALQLCCPCWVFKVMKSLALLWAPVNAI